MVYDSIAPGFVYFPADTVIEVNGFCVTRTTSWSVTGGEPTANDNCDICFDQNLDISYVEVKATVDCGENARERWQNCDAHLDGNRPVWQLNFTGTKSSRLRTSEAPTFNEALPGDLTLECTADEAAVLTASDNCSDVEVIFTR